MQVLGQLLTIVGSSNDPVLLSQVHRLVSSHPPLLSAYQKRQSEHSLRQLIARATPPVTPSRMSTRDIVKQALEEASAVVATIDSDDKSPSPRIPTCSICLDRLIETIIFPCRHFFCGICSLTITKCGFCRQTIQVLLFTIDFFLHHKIVKYKSLIIIFILEPSSSFLLEF